MRDQQSGPEALAPPESKPATDWRRAGAAISALVGAYLIMQGLTTTAPDKVEGHTAAGEYIVIDCSMAALNVNCWPSITPWQVALGLLLLIAPAYPRRN